MDYSFFLILMVVLSFIIFIRVPRRRANLFINYILRLDHNDKVGKPELSKQYQ